MRYTSLDAAYMYSRLSCRVRNKTGWVASGSGTCETARPVPALTLYQRKVGVMSGDAGDRMEKIGQTSPTQTLECP
jgi:hypothetical protein